MLGHGMTGGRQSDSRTSEGTQYGRKHRILSCRSAVNSIPRDSIEQEPCLRCDDRMPTGHSAAHVARRRSHTTGLLEMWQRKGSILLQTLQEPDERMLPSQLGLLQMME
eukprot:766485-Hanusia_phi.AAC.2